MIRVELHLVRPRPAVQPSAEAIAAQLAQAAANLPQVRPGPELWEITAKHPKGRYDLKDVMGRRMGKVPAIGPGALRLRIGQVVIVEYYDRARRKPFIRTLGASAGAGKTTSPLLGLWICPEASAGLLSRSSADEPQLIVSGDQSLAFLAGLTRTSDESEFYRGDNYSDILGLLAYSLGPSAAPTLTTLASMHAVWDPGPSATTGGKVVITEVPLAGAGADPIEIDIPLTRYIVTSGNPGINRLQGYFFLHQLDQNDLVYVVAVDSGIAAVKRSQPGTVVLSDWVTDPRRNGVHSGNVSAFEQFLCECGYSGLAESGSLIVTGGARFQTYQRNGELAYIANPPVELAGLVPGLSGSASERKKVFAVGILDPGDWGHVLQSTRWPLLRVEDRREWVIYVNLVANPNPHWLTVGVNAATGQARLWDDFQPDLSWKMLYSSLLSVESARLQGQCDESQEPDGIPAGSLGPKEYVDIGYTVDPGDPEADPPVPPTIRTFRQDIFPMRRGDYYSGTRQQAPGIVVAPDYSTMERFVAFPFPMDGGGGATADQVPSGCIDKATNGPVTVCAELQHYAHGLHLVDDVNINFEVDAQFSNDSAWHKSRDRSYSEVNGSDYFIWWITKAISIFTGEAVDVDPHLFVTPVYTTAEDDPAGNDVHGNPAGNSFLGGFDPIAERSYSRKRHGEYSYAIRHRTWANFFTPDGKLKFRADISRYYVDNAPGDFPGCNPSPQLLNIWDSKTVGSFFWVLRQDYIDPTPNGDGVQTSGGQEPTMDLLRINDSGLTLLHSVNLHHTEDLPAREWSPSYKRPPHFVEGITPEGKPYATVWTEWQKGSDFKHLVTELILDGGSVTRSEAWDRGDTPRMGESSNLVHLAANLYWIGNGGDLIVGKATT